MKIFASSYLEAWSEDIDGGNDWSWEPVDGYKNVRGRPTKSQVVTFAWDGNPDTDQPGSGTSGMLVA